MEQTIVATLCMLLLRRVVDEHSICFQFYAIYGIFSCFENILI